MADLTKIEIEDYDNHSIHEIWFNQETQDVHKVVQHYLNPPPLQVFLTGERMSYRRFHVDKKSKSDFAEGRDKIVPTE